MHTPTDPMPSVPADAGTGRAPHDDSAPAAAKPRLSRPTPATLFADRQDGDARPVRTTRAVPGLADPAQRSRPSGTADGTRLPLDPPPADTPGPDHAPEFPPDLVFIVRAGGAVLHVNRPLGRRIEEEIVGTQFSDWVFPEQHPAVNAALARVFATGQADGVELHGIQGHDADAWFECRIAPNVRDGKVVSVTIIARDITRYKDEERALLDAQAQLARRVRDREEELQRLQAVLADAAPDTGGNPEWLRFRATIDMAGEAIFLVDPARNVVVDLNETACRWAHRRCSEVRGAAVAALGLEFPLVPPVTLDVQFTETRDLRRPLTLEGQHRRQDGSTFPVEVSVIPVEYDGTPYLLAVARDVKDRQRTQEAVAEAEAQYRALAEQSFDAVYLTTRGGEIVEANAAAFSMFGYRRDEFIGLDARTVMPDVDDIRRFQQVMARDRFVARLDVTLRRRDGTGFAAILSASRRRDADDRLLGYQWVVREVSGPAVAGPDLEEAAAADEPQAPEGWGSTPDVATEQPAAPDASDASTGGKVVLLVGGRARDQRDGVQALERAGFAVLQADDGGAAIRAIRTHGASVDVAVVSGQGDEEPESIARDLLALAGHLLVVLVRPEGDLVAPVDMVEAPVLREPVHPLALLQAVRDILAPGA